MSTLKLVVDEQDAIELIALRCNEPAYKVAWYLNRKLGLDLMKVEEYDPGVEDAGEGSNNLFQSSEVNPTFEVFALEEEEQDLEGEVFVLVTNNDQGAVLFSEAKGFDMVIFNSLREVGTDDLKKTLTDMEGMLTLQEIECTSFSKLINPFNYFDT
jgi:hypothetical protein